MKLKFSFIFFAFVSGFVKASDLDLPLPDLTDDCAFANTPAGQDRCLVDNSFKGT